MSCNYADGLSPYHDKGQLGLDEKFDSKSVVNAKVSLLAKWINEAKHVVIHTGAGISTSAGIPDFRGPKGVWTLQAKGQKPDSSTDFNEAIPTPTHMAITKMVEKGKVKYVISQNIDGLHLRSNLQRKYLSELHGNMFIEQCNTCNRQFVRNSAAPTVGQKSLNKACPTIKGNGRPCRGRLHDTILDWEHSLPENDLGMADFHSCLSDLSICLGTTMQIVPSGNLPLYTKKHGGKLVICNLQPTKHDRKADLLIHSYVDEVMTLLMKALNLKIPKYSAKNDPTKSLTLSSDKYFEWTISDLAVSKMRKIYEDKCGTKEAKKRLNMIDDDDLPLRITRTLKKSKGDEKSTDDDLEVLDVFVKAKKGSSSKEKRGQKRQSSSPTVYNTTITVKKVSSPKKGKYEGEKITIKKNVTPTKTKYEIVQPKSEKKKVKCEIVYSTNDELCDDLEMICESGSDDSQNCFTYNYRRYLHEEKTFKQEAEEKKSIEKVEEAKVDETQKTDVEKIGEIKEESCESKETGKDKEKEIASEEKVNSEKEEDQSESPNVDTELRDKAEEHTSDVIEKNVSEKIEKILDKDNDENKMNSENDKTSEAEDNVVKNNCSVEEVQDNSSKDKSGVVPEEQENAEETSKSTKEKEIEDEAVEAKTAERESITAENLDSDNPNVENVVFEDGKESEEKPEENEKDVEEKVVEDATEDKVMEVTEDERITEVTNDDKVMDVTKDDEVMEVTEDDKIMEIEDQDKSIEISEPTDKENTLENTVMEVVQKQVVVDTKENEGVSERAVENDESVTQKLKEPVFADKLSVNNFYNLSNAGAEFPNIPPPNIENAIQSSLDQLVNQGSEPFSTTLVSNLASVPSTEERFLNQSLGENYNNFYDGNFSTPETNPDLDYVDNTYYSNY